MGDLLARIGVDDPLWGYPQGKDGLHLLFAGAVKPNP